MTLNRKARRSLAAKVRRMRRRLRRTLIRMDKAGKPMTRERAAIMQRQFNLP